MQTFELEKGISHGDVHHKTCAIKTGSIGDLKNAISNTSQVSLVPAGFDDKHQPVFDAQLLSSPQLFALETLRLRIAKLGDLTMPLEIEQFDKLSETDLEILQRHADIQDGKAMLEVLDTRGKPATASASADTSG